MTPSKRPPEVSPSTALHGGGRNRGTELRLDWLDELHAGERALGPVANTLRADASRDHDREAERLLDVIALLDLTSLGEDDTEDRIRALCRTAVDPIPADVIGAWDAAERAPSAAAVCVFDRFVSIAREALDGSGVLVAAVTAGFPVPLSSLSQRLADVRATVEAGADEIDLVIDRDKARTVDWPTLYEEVRALRDACGPARLKTILAAGDLGSLETVARTGLVCCMAGADFIKTSTGREQINATLPIGLAMAGAIRLYAERAGYAVGLKPAGGIHTVEDALAWLHLAREELGDEWSRPERFRIGASSLLREIERRLRELSASAP